MAIIIPSMMKSPINCSHFIKERTLPDGEVRCEVSRLTCTLILLAPNFQA